MQVDKYTTKSTQETQKIAQEFAGQILQKKPGNHAVVLALSGDLGAGKTTFTQGFARGLGITEKILSPTFVILKHFPITGYGLPIAGYKSFYHIDCYRLEDEKDVLELGLKEILKNPENIVLIEWPERIKKILPKDIISIDFEHLTESERALTIKAQGDII